MTISLSIDEFLTILNHEKSVDVYTDGSCIGNPGPGGWGAVFIYGNAKSFISGSENSTTNNRMEILAAIHALETLPERIDITIHTDSTYLKYGITSWIKSWKQNGWISSSKKPVKNKDLWERLDKIVCSRNVKWIWVKGHGDCENNNSADCIAKSAIVESCMKSD